MTKLFL